MRKLVVTQFVSLDGVIENPSWTVPYWNDEIAAFKGEETQTSDALLLGRVTYEGFAAAWPQSTDEGAAYFNNVRKYVVSTTLSSVAWHNSVLITGDVAAEIARLKQENGQNITVHGSATLVQTLIRHNLVDVYRLLMYPVVVGQGKRLFHEGTTATLSLMQTQTFSGGVIGLIYQPQQAE